MLNTVTIDSRVHGKAIDLIDKPVVVRVTKFDEDGAKSFSEEVSKAHETGQTVIPIVIDSYGGQVYSLLDMITQIQSSKIPIVTVLEGKGMSCGAMLFAMGHQRFMAEHATLMLHDVASGSYGKLEEIKSDAVEFDRLQRLIFSIISKNIGRPADYFTKIIHDKSHAEWYLNARQAKKHGLCTRIGIPTLTTEVSVSYKFEW
jgi:ATP-dependent protease ClpP protease subunit